MKQKYLSEVVYQIFALVIVVIVVHAIYVAVIRPNADIIAVNLYCYARFRTGDLYHPVFLGA